MYCVSCIKAPSRDNSEYITTNARSICDSTDTTSKIQSESENKATESTDKENKQYRKFDFENILGALDEISSITNDKTLDVSTFLISSTKRVFERCLTKMAYQLGQLERRRTNAAAVLMANTTIWNVLRIKLRLFLDQQTKEMPKKPFKKLKEA